MKIRPLIPDPNTFAKCYPSWCQSIARVIGESGNGTVFALNGRWGSGKTSACLALAPHIYQHTRGRVSAIARVDCSRLSGAFAEDFVEMLNDEVSVEDASRFDALKVRAAVYHGLQLIAESVSGAARQTGTKLAAAATQILAAAGEEQVAQLRLQLDLPVEVERVYLFLDDLDRTDATLGIRVMEFASRLFERQKVECVCIVACDPMILCAQMAAALGLSQALAMQAFSKYIHVPLQLPVEVNCDAHASAIFERLCSGAAITPELTRAALAGVGIVPFRDLLAALPQAAMWGERLDLRDESLRRMKVHAVLVASLIASCVPRIFECLRFAPDGSFGRALAAAIGREEDGASRVFGSWAPGYLESRSDVQAFAQRIAGLGTGPQEPWDELARAITH